MTEKEYELSSEESQQLQAAIRIAISYLATYPNSDVHNMCDSRTLVRLFHRLQSGESK
jgi:hypothetical protein